jgi:hypothetical protein
MGKFILTEEDRNRIKKLHNIQEQSTILAQVKGDYTASNCDELHAFQGTGGKTIGNMNGIVKDKILELNKQGHKVKVTKVSVVVKGMNVIWTVDISKSDDNKNWVGFTSRGAGCNSDIQRRWNNDSVGNGAASIKNKIESSGYGAVDEIELVNTFTHTSDENSFIQGFYRYCLMENNQSTNIQPSTNQQTNQEEYIVASSNDANTFYKKLKIKQEIKILIQAQ